MQVYHYVKPQAFNTKHMINAVRSVKTQQLRQVSNAVGPTWLSAAG